VWATGIGVKVTQHSRQVAQNTMHSISKGVKRCVRKDATAWAEIFTINHNG